MKNNMKNKKIIDELLGKPARFYEKFHQMTKITKFEIKKPVKSPDQWKKKYFKGYGRYKALILTKPELPDINYKNVLENRKSTRDFKKTHLSLKKISTVLYYSAGLKKDGIHRYYPSGGARYPLEVYVLAINSNLPKGLYHYYQPGHLLELIPETNVKSLLGCFNQSWLNAGIVIIITAVFQRMTNKYNDRGYRHILQETGHLGQNIYLTSTALNLGCCAIGGYLDDQLNTLVGIDGIKESIVYCLSIGTPKNS